MDVEAARSGSLSGETLLSMGPARQAVLLGGLPPVTAGALLMEVGGAKARAGVLASVPQDARGGILEAIQDGKQREATRKALKAFLLENAGAAGGVQEDGDVRAAAEAAAVAKAHADEAGRVGGSRSRATNFMGSLFGGGKKDKAGGAGAAQVPLPLGHQQKASASPNEGDSDDDEEEEEEEDV